ncbi:MAG: HAMP domain-containing sensor histidine kinase [Clostridia bacterium]|nr:HAMP domain-containing sensor histidine kinase [Clostridia bacterium]
MKKEKKKKESKKQHNPKQIKRSIRTAMSLIVFLILLSSVLLTIAIYYLFAHFKIIRPNGSGALWIAAIVFLVCNIIGAIVSSVVFSRYTKPLYKAVQAIDRLGTGDYDVRLETKDEKLQIRELMETINKTAEELGSIEKMRNDFVDIVSHEYKTPVASISGFAKRLKNGPLTEEQREYTDIIIDESKYLTSMTTNLLLLSRFENTSIIPDKKLYSLDEQLRRSVIRLQNEWQEKDISVEGDFDKIDFFGNEDIVSHIWDNLIKNAIKCTDKGGSIYCSAKEENGFAVVVIRDSGCGMSKKTLEHIFDKFYQADESRNSNGHGLGLSIVKRLVDLCDGTIDVQSELQHGTQFTVRLKNSPSAT